MARSVNIYVVYDQDSGIFGPVAAFTVKRELVSYLKSVNGLLSVFSMRVWRIKDNDPGKVVELSIRDLLT